MDAPSRTNKFKLCKCPKCLRNSENGMLLNPVTYWRHAKYREEETIAQRAALFAQFGLEAPSASSSSAGGLNQTRKRKKRAMTVHAPEQPDINQDFEDPSRDSINDPNHFYPQDPDIDEAMHEIQQDLIPQEPPHSPTSPPPNDNPRELPHSPQPESEPGDEEESSSNDDGEKAPEDDEEGEDDEGVDLPSVSTNDPWPQPALPKLALAKEMIENIKAARLEDDLDEDMLARLKCPPEEPEALDDITPFSMSIFNNLISCSERIYDGVRAAIQQNNSQAGGTAC